VSSSVTFKIDSAPTIATAASATPNPVTGTSTVLSVLGADNDGEAGLTYSWATTGTPPAAVSFSVNGTNAAKTTTATFAKAGTYSFKVTVTDGSGFSTTSSVNVTVNQTLTSVDVTPATATLNTGTTRQFSAIAYDQFGLSMLTQPSFTWSIFSGGGSISSSGLYTAPATAGTATIRATVGSVSDTAVATIGIGLQDDPRPPAMD
jgi:hypothetical protein